MQKPFHRTHSSIRAAEEDPTGLDSSLLQTSAKVAYVAKIDWVIKGTQCFSVSGLEIAFRPALLKSPYALLFLRALMPQTLPSHIHFSCAVRYDAQQVLDPLHP